MNQGPVSTMATTERRTATRHPVRWPVALEGGFAVTHNLSASGVLMECDHEFRRGTSLHLAIALPADEAACSALVCDGEVVRAEHAGEQVWKSAVAFSNVRLDQVPTGWGDETAVHRCG